jgi:hypothetical protein
MDFLESIQASLDYLLHLATEETNESRSLKILQYRKDRIAELREMANRLDNYTDEI